MSKTASLKVEEFTSPNIFTALPGESLTNIAQKMAEESIRHIPIFENGKVLGILSQRDLYLIDKNKFESLKAQDVMSVDPYTVSKSDLIHEVAFEMSTRKIGSAIVEDNGKVYGIFTTTDALNALVEIVRGEI